jgi:tRNA modification GTPase
VAEVIREGFKISIIGPPNAGKSTLMNMLAKRQVSIVSDVPGTTRDLLQTNINLDGYNIILSDTAGLRQSSDQIEQQGIAMALEQSSSSQGLVIIVDINSLQPLDDNAFELTDPMVQQQILSNGAEKLSLILLNKIDQSQNINNEKMVKIKVQNTSLNAFPLSLKEGTNVQQNLMEQLKKMLHQVTAQDVGLNQDSS